MSTSSLTENARLSSSRPRILVLMATRDGKPYLEEQLASILSQAGVNVAVAVSDDASGDGTAAILETLRGETLEYHVNLKPSGSAAQNFLRLIRQTPANGYDFVALADQDDVWMPEKLARAVRALATFRSHGYSSSVIARWPDGSESTYRQSSKIRAADFLFEGAGQGCTFVLSTILYQRAREVLIAYEDRTAALVYHDWALYGVARSLGFDWHFDREPSMWYRQHGNNDTGARFTLRGIANRLAQMHAGRYRTQIKAVSALCAELGSVPAQQWRTLDRDRGRDLRRRLWKARFCWRDGRRKLLDRGITVFAALLGWL